MASTRARWWRGSGASGAHASDTARAPALYVFAMLEALEGRAVGAAEVDAHPTVERVALSVLCPTDPARLLDRRERLLFEIDAALSSGDVARASAAVGRQPHAWAALELDQARFHTAQLTAWDGLLDSADYATDQLLALVMAQRYVTGAAAAAARHGRVPAPSTRTDRTYFDCYSARAVALTLVVVAATLWSLRRLPPREPGAAA